MFEKLFNRLLDFVFERFIALEQLMAETVQELRTEIAELKDAIVAMSALAAKTDQTVELMHAQLKLLPTDGATTAVVTELSSLIGGLKTAATEAHTAIGRIETDDPDETPPAPPEFGRGRNR